LWVSEKFAEALPQIDLSAGSTEGLKRLRVCSRDVFSLVTPALMCINCLKPISLQLKLNMTVSLENMAYFLLLVSF